MNYTPISQDAFDRLRNDARLYVQYHGAGDYDLVRSNGCNASPTVIACAEHNPGEGYSYYRTDVAYP